MKKALAIFLALGSTVLLGFNCVKSKSSDQSSSKEFYLEQGKKVSSATQAVLGKNLMAAMGNGGPVNALEFCNVNAIPLTDSMAIALKTMIKRVSDQARNPDNNANGFEKNIIEKQKKQIQLGEQPMPEVHERKGKMIAYYPIVTNAMCLNCHGKVNETVGQKTYDRISKYYPKDQAMNYSSNELRGLWVIEMEKK